MPCEGVSFPFADRNVPPSLTLMDLMVSWHAKVHGHLFRWRRAHIHGGVTCSDGGGAWIATKDRFQN